ncbi:MAG: dual specificity protein phosphatase family protein, partial [Thaumarchaeota archaeon]|nr:dual specificity protein phosphatase family protein [Nitrososphaerota archaeon]
EDVNYLHVPTTDLTSPDMDKIDTAVDFIHSRINNKEPVMVHCAAGMGRTGTVLACYLVKYQKYSAKDAIEKVRTERPGSIQSEVQELAIQFFEKHTSN